MSRRQKNILAAVGIGLIGLSVGLSGTFGRESLTSEKGPTVAPSAGHDSSGEFKASASLIEQVALVNKAALVETGEFVKADPPHALSGFWGWSSDQQMEHVTKLQSNAFLSPEVRDFFLNAIRCKELGETTRNNVANALINQVTKDPTLCRLFASMSRDPEESARWRDYALQQMANSLPFAQSAESEVRLLWELAEHQTDALQGTALLHLHRLQEVDVIHLDERYGNLLTGIIGNEGCDIPVRMTAISIAAERKAKQCLGAIRAVSTASNVSLKRVALAALGQMGTADDVAIIERHQNDGDPGVRLAAQGALRRMQSVRVEPTSNVRSDSAADSPEPNVNF